MREEREREKRDSERDSEHAREAGTCGTCSSECYLTTMGGDLASAAALGEGSEKNGPPLQEHNPQKQGHQGAGFGHRLLSGMVCPAQQKARRGRRPARARLPTSERLLAPTLELGRERGQGKQVPKRGARARASAARCCGVWCPLRSSRRSKGAGVRAPRRLPLRVCLPACLKFGGRRTRQTG